MTGQEMVALSKQHSLYEWSAQAHVDPIPVANAKGIYFWTPEGKRFIDFNSQLMCVNIGHGDRARDQGDPGPGGDARLRESVHGHRGARAAGRRSSPRSAPGDIDVFFFTNGGAEANENAIRIARLVTGRHKILRALSLVSRRHRRAA